MKKIYFDNAATSWPKPDVTIGAMNEFNSSIGANPGRSGHTLSIEAGRVIYDTRESISELFNIDDPLQTVFTKNATEALNIFINGFFKPGDHVITSGMEHNSVMRPLRALQQHGLEISQASCSANGELDPADVEKLIKANTKAVILTHSSNVTGTILPVEKVGKIAHDNGLVLCVDSAQTAGAVPIDVDEMNIDILAFTGHKCLYGPQGTGGLYIRKGIEEQINPLMRGGTGSNSEKEDQPDFMPDRFESGTPNAIGLSGLLAGVEFVKETGVKNIRQHEMQLTQIFLDWIRDNNAVKLHGPDTTDNRTPVISFSIEGMSPSEISFALDDEFGIMTRPGLHCAPSAHKTIGTYPHGTVRFSFGYFTTVDEVAYSMEALEKICAKCSVRQ